MHSGERTRPGEDGQMTLAMMLLAVAVLAIGVTFFVFGQATDARGTAQKAADSGSLAAADEMRDRWARAWVTTQIVPSSAGVTPGYDHSHSLPIAAAAGHSSSRAAAQDFAWRNDETTVEDYSVFPAATNPTNAIRLSVGTQSPELQAVDDGIGALQGEAGSIAEVRASSPVTCQKEAYPGPGTISGWRLQCSSAEGTSASAYYLSSSPVPVDLPGAIDRFAEFFDVRLVD